ncbi:MAG TPA: helix-turn-helix transcriptional regulator [Bdellovibrionota bacterium]|nr:helix-turn-helix transcriptional regulator [Bdellovibrionota bacterium]
MYRHVSFDKALAKELQKRDFAREFLLAQMEGDEALPLVEALRVTIRRMGVKEFAKKAHIRANNVSRMLNGHVEPSIDTLDHFLGLFGLRTKLFVEKVA